MTNEEWLLEVYNGLENIRDDLTHIHPDTTDPIPRKDRALFLLGVDTELSNCLHILRRYIPTELLNRNGNILELPLNLD